MPPLSFIISQTNRKIKPFEQKKSREISRDFSGILIYAPKVKVSVLSAPKLWVAPSAGVPSEEVAVTV